MDISSVIPPILVTLNALSASLVGTGYFNIRKGNKTIHKACMSGALAVSAVFMIIYLYYHTTVGFIPFAGKGNVRYVYFPLLTSHVILATLVLPMILTSAGLALVGKFAQHKRIARWTVPVWLYVSITGIIIYIMSYHIYPK